MSVKYLSADQVAVMTGYSPWTVREQAKQYARDVRAGRKKPRGLKGSQPVGRVWRFREEDVHKFMTS